MLHYHKIMQYVWLVMSGFVIITTTYLCITDDFSSWWMMYLFLFATVLQYFRHKIQLKKMSPKQDEKAV